MRRKKGEDSCGTHVVNSSVSLWIISIDAKIYAFKNDKTCVCHTSEQMIMCKSIPNSISCATLMVWNMNLLYFIFLFHSFYFNGQLLKIEHSTLKYDVVKCVLVKRHTVEVISFQWTNEFYLLMKYSVEMFLCVQKEMLKWNCWTVGSW